MSKVIKISAKCSDLFSASLFQDGKQIGSYYDGYVPSFFPNEHCGDYVELNIDIDTGKILNWKVPSSRDLVNVFGAAPKLSKMPVIKHIQAADGTNLCGQAKGSITVKGKQYASINDLTKDRSFKLKNGNNSHLKLKRDEKGHFIKMDTIMEFNYPHRDPNSYYHSFDQNRVVKIISETDTNIEGIQLNGMNRGYKKFIKSKIVDKIKRDKAYAKDIK